MESRRKILTGLFAEQQWRHRHREQTYGHGERGGEGKMYGKGNMETYITMCKIDSHTANSRWLSILHMVM